MTFFWFLTDKMLLLTVFLLLFDGLMTSYTPIAINNVTYNKEYQFSVNNSVGYILSFSGEKKNLPHQVKMFINGDYSQNLPLMVVAQTSNEQLSWKLPMIVESQNTVKYFSLTSRIICQERNNTDISDDAIEVDNPIISISTASKKPISFYVNVSYVEDFYIKPSIEYKTEISPSEPKYFYYEFEKSNKTTNDQDSNYETVILKVTSDYQSCMIVSIQDVKCPVLDLNQDITYRGFYETVTTKGGITIPKYKFPNGFYVVFVAKGDKNCMYENLLLQNDKESLKKNITFKIEPSISYSDYQSAVLITIATIAIFYIFFLSGYAICIKKTHIPRSLEYVTPSCSTVNTPTVSGNVDLRAETLADSVSLDEQEYDDLIDADRDKEVRLCKSALFLHDLARKDPRIHRQKSYLYLYNVLTIALFYGLPAIQLVVTYQRVLNTTGEQDLCYYNFLCAHPLGNISDFNHVFSNIGYIFLGILFLFIVYKRERTHQDLDFERSYGIPQHYGMFYSMGVALIMEGILSGSYHVCPNQTNFQFDSSFMYVMAVLCMVKLYQNRHPDINANSYSTFGVLAIAILLGMVGIMEGHTFLIFFTVIHILICLYLTLQIYYMGCWRCDKGVFLRIYRTFLNDFRAGPLNIFIPTYKARFFLLLVGNIINWMMATFALIQGGSIFALYLLAVFMMNTLLYFFFYILMKYYHKEKVNKRSWVFLILSWICAISAMYFFLHKSISWTQTPAESRKYNTECKLLRFYDYHDIWHFLSAIGMFFTFMVLLTMDDDLSHVHRTQIPVF